MKGNFQLKIDDTLELNFPDESRAGELFELIDANREYLRQWLPWLDNNKYLQNTIDFIKLSRKQYSDNLALNLAVCFRSKIAGIISLHRFDWPNRSAHIGYWLGEKYQGKGLITRSCQGLLDYSFSDMGLNRVDIRCAPANSRSRAIPQRLGFKEEGVLRQMEWLYEHFVDHVVYSMLRDEWLKLYKKTPLNPEEEVGGLREAKGKM
jgi:ribosomal-protein-serine acetyltransferase